MPTYEYECGACGHLFEKFQSIKANSLRKCPECKKLKLERLVGAGAAIIFKGSGFYETDYRSESYKAAAKKDSEAGSSASGEKSSGGDKKSGGSSSSNDSSSSSTATTEKTSSKNSSGTKESK